MKCTQFNPKTNLSKIKIKSDFSILKSSKSQSIAISHTLRPQPFAAALGQCPAAAAVCKAHLPPSKPLKASERLLFKPISAVSSGLEASITEPNVISVKNVEIVVESQDDDKIQVRVDLLGKETQTVFDKVLRSLARSAPPVPGFRREKGGKTTKVPTDFLLQILGEARVTNFVIQEIVSSTLADYVKKENLTVKENKVNTIQTAEELKSV
ncbi:PREDICTED: uncharacterized protein LOC105958813 [Erythranthe guttata]|uniref:uncharacterized protein LOC105958813 n=1 Tax=Erythranthe guttata TaxID=4155 RepID=UPI00064DB55D|nr:PREDICTED: uncharacterized protein LOC105958813 [Erythranthe guttata]|eukprot:XP_012838269.1 PREDICTED: uncharacterized protein LOC105958813 [Erythranthe guttata]